MMWRRVFRTFLFLSAVFQNPQSSLAHSSLPLPPIRSGMSNVLLGKVASSHILLNSHKHFGSATLSKSHIPLRSTLSYLLKNGSKRPIVLSTGSRATQNLISELKSLSAASYNSGQASAIFNQAVVSNGGLLGTFYFPMTGPGLGNDGPAFLAFGSSPFNNQQFNSGNYPSFGATNLFSVANANPSMAHSSSGFAGGSLLASRLSGSQKALLSLFRGVASSGYKAGFQAGTLPGTVTGGQFDGTFYFANYPVSNSYGHFSEALFAFGNSPLNNPAIASVMDHQASFIEFSNGVTKNISSGSLFFNFYQTNGYQAPFFAESNPAFFALGSNNVPGIFTATSLISTLIFK